MLWEDDGVLAINHCSVDAGSAVATRIEVLPEPTGNPFLKIRESVAADAFLTPQNSLVVG